MLHWSQLRLLDAFSLPHPTQLKSLEERLLLVYLLLQGKAREIIRGKKLQCLHPQNSCMIGQAFVFEQKSQTMVNEWRGSTLEVHLKLERPYKGLFNFRALRTSILKQGLTSNSLPLSRDEIPTFDVLQS